MNKEAYKKKFRRFRVLRRTTPWARIGSSKETKEEFQTLKIFFGFLLKEDPLVSPTRRDQRSRAAQIARINKW